MSITPKTLKYREELRKIDEEFKKLESIPNKNKVNNYKKLFERLRLMIKGPFDVKSYNEKNKEKIKEYHKQYYGVYKKL